MTTKAIRLALCAAAMGAATANAENYTVEAGASETMTLSGGDTTTYDAVTVAGNLTVTGDGWVQTTNLNLVGGTLTFDDKKASFGDASRTGTYKQTTTYVSASENGTYGKVSVQNGTGTGGIGNSTTQVYRFNFATRKFYVNADATATGNGDYADILSIDTGSVAIGQFYNNSALTARVSVAGTAYLTKGQGYCFGENIFEKGPIEIVLQNEADLTVDVKNQQGSFNAANVPVIVTGTGDLVLRCTFLRNQEKEYPMRVRKGAMIDNSGNLVLDSEGTYGGIFTFYDGVVGSNVVKVSSSGTRIIMRIASASTVTVRDLDIARTETGDCLVADAATGVVRIDASASPRTFRANMPPQYSYRHNNTDLTKPNLITVEKTGGYEATISAS